MIHDFRTLMQTIVQHWQETVMAYTAYMENGKKFRYTEILRTHNTAVKNLLTEYMNIIPADLVEDAKAIIEHYTIWTAKWDQLKATLNPGPDDVFVFENEHRFPRVAAQRLEGGVEC